MNIRFEERVLQGEGKYKIYVVDLRGTIVDESSSGGLLRKSSSQFSTRYFELIAQIIRNDKDARGVLLRVNSPGGTAVASDALYTELDLIRNRMPVFAHIEGVGASGSYMACLATDMIFAQRSAWVGSIGVIMQQFDISEGLAKIGIKANTIKSAPMKDALSPFRPLEKAEEDYLKALLYETFERFKNLVLTNRQIAPEFETEVFSARIFHAEHALALGLIDGIYTIYQTNAKLLTYLKVRYPNIALTNYRFVKLFPKQSRLGSLFGALEMRVGLFPELGLTALMLANPGPWCIWLP